VAVVLRLPAGARSAAIASGAMIAQQVAGKAARDAFFLSSFRVEDLPAMMAASALVSLFAALGLSRLMVRYSPAKVVPVVFAASGTGLLAEWGVSFVAPRITAVALYLHTALFGAVVISAFWSLINETFAPHSGRRAVRWITGAGTFGGVLGGLIAWRAAHLIPLPSMLVVLAGVNVISVWGSWRLRTPASTDDEVALVADAAADDPPGVPGAPDLPTRALFRLLWGTPYLRNLALVVMLGAVTSGLLDYVFSVVAVDHYTRGPQLLAFFAKFWLVVGLLSFLLETLFGKIALEKLGLAFTVAILPAVVVLGSALGIAVPGLFSMVVLRGGEASQRNSLFREAYELLYTPLSAQRKRAAKTLIDVGCDRAGTVVAGGVAMATVALYEAPLAGMVLLVIAMGCGLLSVARSIPLHRGYVALLEEGLRGAARQMAARTTTAAAQPALEVALRDKIVEELERELDIRSSGEKSESIDKEVHAVLELRSGKNERVRAVLASEGPLPAPLVAFVMLLLADKEFHLDAIKALVRSAPTSIGQLVDALCDPRVDFHTRRRVPRVLSHCPTLAAAEGLLRGIEDERFEVRYACGRALLKIRAANPQIAIPLDRIVAIVTREVARDQTMWDTELDSEEQEDDAEAPSLVDRLRHDRLDRSVEHVFNVLALYIDPESLRTAFKALHERDDALRGTALEYLETVLPDEVRDLVWPFVGEARPMRAARPAEDILADLVRARSA
jgi:AAA family ATP:ADP antiporter